MSEPRLTRITGQGDEAYGLDLEGKVWSFEIERPYSYQRVWRELPMPAGSRWISDLYYNVCPDGEGRDALRVLTREGQIWQWQYSRWDLIWKPE